MFNNDKLLPPLDFTAPYLSEITPAMLCLLYAQAKWNQMIHSPEENQHKDAPPVDPSRQ